VAIGPELATMPAPVTTVPLLSIGMPVYNGERTMRSALESLLAQTLTDFELILSDNASSDGSWDVIQEFAARDPRVRAFRQPRNIGANANYTALFRAARGKYFKWASSNDWCAPEFLQCCVEQLEADPGAVLVAPRTRLFESDPAVFQDYLGDIACTQPDPVDRFKHVGERLALNNVVNGVARADALRQTHLVEHYPSADVVLVAHLALLGRIVLLPQPLFYRRMDRASATALMGEVAVHRHHYPVTTWRSSLPAWRLAWGWVRTACAARPSVSGTARALYWAVRRAYWNRALLGRDLLQLPRYPIPTEPVDRHERV
jgi:glycosyltransferase involved in cell wall biosynthesis